MTGRHKSQRKNGLHVDARAPQYTADARYDEYGDEIERPGRTDYGERYFATQPGTRAAAEALATWIRSRNGRK